MILKKISEIKKDNKWVLSTNKVVEDIMKSLIQETVYEHPVHSLISDLSDPIWVNYFDENELEEIRTMNMKKILALPLDLSAYISTYEIYITARDMHEFAHNMYYDPIEEFDRKWVQESLIEASEWFIRDSILQVDDYSELDTIINTWSFVYKAFNDKQIRENLGEKVQCVRSHTKKEWKEPGGCGKETKKINRCKNGYIIQLRSHRVGRM